MARLAMITVATVALSAVPAQAEPDRQPPVVECDGTGPPGARCVWFGPWAGVVDCESRGDAQAINRRSGASGIAQFLQLTWNGIALDHDKPRLVSAEPRRHTLAQQMRQSVRLKARYGISQWVCGYRYGDGTGPLWVVGEHESRIPVRCGRNLRDRYGFTRRAAQSICGSGPR